MRTFFKRMVGLGALAALGYTIWRAYDRRKVDSGVTWDPQPFPYPPRPYSDGPGAGERAEAPTVPGPAAWVEADGGSCPATHPVKAKLASGIYHVPGGANYDRTLADRCYPTPDAAETDGLRASKR